MKAIQINTYGGPEILEVNENASQPSIKPGQIFIDVHSAAINPFDVKVRQGYMAEVAPLQFPITLGGDFSGIIKQLGEGVTGFTAGEEIYGTANVLGGGSGAFAEYATAKADNIAKKPENISFVEAAAVPLVGSSAIQALEDHMNLQIGQKILIHGGAGGIGSLAIQLAKALGAYVATTVSPDDKEFVGQLGADEIIDYKNQAFEKILKDFDAVYDIVGGQTADKSFLILKKGGILVSMLGQPNEALAKQYEITAIGQRTKTNTDHLTRLKKYIEEGKIKIHVDKTFPIDQIKEAFTYQETKSPKGKVVIKITY